MVLVVCGPGLRAAFSQVPADTQEGVTFNGDVLPVIIKHCAICHRPGGDAPFSLLTYREARQRGSVIAQVTAGRQMPPWNAESDFGPFQGLESLSDAEIETFQQWHQTGMAEGAVAADAPPVRASGWQLGVPDMVIELPESYLLPADGPDRFRTFVLPLSLQSPRLVRGLEFRPGARAVVHHANILLDATARSRELDLREEGPGYEGPLARTAMYPDGHLLGYAPGQPDPLLPSTLAWTLEPGTDLVLQLHLKPSGKPEAVRPSVGLYFSDEAAARAPVMLRLGRQSLDILPGERDYRVTDVYQLPVDIEVLALRPHAHYRARTVRASVTLPGGASKELLSIPEWDFDWQNVYRFVEPVSLPRGAEIEVEFLFDNSELNPVNPVIPPQRVTWGPASTDEMADVWIQVLAPDDAATTALLRDFRPKAVAAELEGYRSLLERDPYDPVLHDDIAMLHLEAGEPKTAANHLEESLRLRPTAASHYNLGTALLMSGQLEPAEKHLRQAVALRPDYAAAHVNLGNALAALDRTDDAFSSYSAALALDASNARARNGLASLLMAQGRLDEAARHLRRAIADTPPLVEAHHNLALVEQARGQHETAAKHFEEALRYGPDLPLVLADYAWMVATAPEADVRDGTRAVQLAERAARLGNRQDAHVLAALAAAYAEVGRFDEALHAVGEALLLLPSESLSRTLMAHRRLYDMQRPIRTVGSLRP